MKDETIIKVCAIMSIATLELANLIVFGVDGTILTLVVGAICGLAGYELGVKHGKNKKS